MLKNQPFNDLPWQYFPKPRVNHRPPILNYGFPLDISELKHIAHKASILNPEEPLTGDDIMTIMVQVMRYLEKECGLLREEFLSVAGCYSRTVRFVLMLKTNYNVKHIPPEKLERTARLLGKYFPGKSPQWYLDPDIAEDKYRDFTIPGSAFSLVVGCGS
jgi:hypothetical protein